MNWLKSSAVVLLLYFLDEIRGGCLTFAGESSETTGSTVPPVASIFKVGDKVRVDLEVEVLRVMQEGHGGWNPKMAEVSVAEVHQ